MSSTDSSRITPTLLVILATLSAVAPFSTDLYLAGFPSISRDLDADAAEVQLTLTAFLVGLAAGQLLFGPLSDRLGRRRPLLWGSAILVVASAATVFAPTLELLVAARLVQGFTGAAGMVIGRAVIADLARGRAAARAFSLMMVVGGLAPVAAPLIGSTLMDVIGWRGTLGVLAFIAIVMLAGSVFVIRETLPPEKRAVGRGLGLRELASRRYLAATATFACSFAVMMSYISASPFVYQEVMGLTTVGYGLMFGLNALGLVTSSTIASRLVVRLTPERVLGFGVVGIITSNIVLTTLIVSGVPAIWLSIPLFFSTSSLGFVSGPSTAIALGAVEKSKGLASAVIGATQFGLGGIAAPLVGLDGSANTLPMGITMLTLAVLATISCLVLRTGSRGTPAGGIPADDAAAPRAARVPDSSAR